MALVVRPHNYSIGRCGTVFFASLPHLQRASLSLRAALYSSQSLRIQARNPAPFGSHARPLRGGCAYPPLRCARPLKGPAPPAPKSHARPLGGLRLPPASLCSAPQGACAPRSKVACSPPRGAAPTPRFAVLGPSRGLRRGTCCLSVPSHAAARGL